MRAEFTQQTPYASRRRTRPPPFFFAMKCQSEWTFLIGITAQPTLWRHKWSWTITLITFQHFINRWIDYTNFDIKNLHAVVEDRDMYTNRAGPTTRGGPSDRFRPFVNIFIIKAAVRTLPVQIQKKYVKTPALYINSMKWMSFDDKITRHVSHHHDVINTSYSKIPATQIPRSL